MNKTFYLLLLLLLPAFTAFADTEPETAEGKRFTISGNIRDKESGEELPGATIYVHELKTGAVTNQYGFYSLSLIPGEYKITISFIGFSPIDKVIQMRENFTMNFEMSPARQQLSEVVITGERPDENIRKNEMSVVRMDIKTINRIPALMGEVDIIKAIQLLPGVQSTSEGSSGFSVRGGSPDQNLILLDEAIVYNASHLLGFFSVFNNDAIKDVTLYKGDIPSSYGGRLSSILDIRMKDGNSKKFAGAGGIGTISSRLTLEGPVIEDKTSFLVAGRRTYVDLFLPFAKNEDIRDNVLYFYDLNAKINHKINDRNRLYLSGYFGRDVFSNEFARMSLGNQTGTLRWNHLFSQKLFSNFTLIQSIYDYELGTAEGNANSFIWKSKMQNQSFKGDFTWYINPNHTLRFGALGIRHTFDPGFAKGTGSESLFTEYRLPQNYALEYGVYISNEHKISSKVMVKYGLRLSAFQNTGSATIYNYDSDFNAIDSVKYAKGKIFNTYIAPEPRLGLNYIINPASSVKASYSRTVQYVHLAQNSTAGTPLDLWFPSSPNVKPQKADQMAVGYFRNFKDNAYETSAEVYYKNMYDVIDFKDNAELLLNPKLEGELRTGKGWSYGMEIMVKKNIGKLNGWISYTLSATRRQIEGINDGNSYRAPYEKPHNISVIINYEFSERAVLSSNWVYSTGSPVTFPTGRAVIGNVIVPIYSDRNSYRLPDYHRLDVSFTYKNKIRENRKWQGEWNFSVYNAYGRKNAWAINFQQDPVNPYVTYAEKTYLFSIIPSITYNFKF
ncbi:MAG: tonb-dependent receptor [Bacteroidetes bacterium]|nr:MAG: tonb-dependent receptor [Bacteroidota bacterium]